MSNPGQSETAQTIPPELVVYDEVLPGGGAHWSLRIRRGYTLRLTDLEGGANVGALFYNQDETSERYNMPDTLKAQHIAYLTAGNVCYSDMGRILVSLTADTCGWHDTICGTSNAAMIAKQYGERHYEDHHNDYYRSGRDAFLMQLGRFNLGLRDLVPNINFFSKVTVDLRGGMNFNAGSSPAGSFVDLRAEMNVLCALNTAPHPLDSAEGYPIKPVRMTIWRSGIGGGPEDPCRLSRPENERGFRNTLDYFAQHEL
ncbi:MAG: urea carboxylase-associated family protein [bacterium]|nr:urea carboxylase-associated family protein [bacterium]